MVVRPQNIRITNLLIIKKERVLTTSFREDLNPDILAQHSPELLTLNKSTGNITLKKWKWSIHIANTTLHRFIVNTGCTWLTNQWFLALIGKKRLNFGLRWSFVVVFFSTKNINPEKKSGGSAVYRRSERNYFSFFYWINSCYTNF